MKKNTIFASINENVKTAMPCSHTEEEMFEIVKERLQDLENGTAGLVDGEEVFSEIRERYGFEA